MKRYQAIAFLLSTAMTVGSVAPVFGASSDVLGHWAEFSITKWQNEGRIGGYEDGTFKPDKPISRAEFVRFLNSAVSTPDGGSVSFSDVSTSDWFYNDVAKAVASKIASGFEDNTFRPSETVTRMQAAVFITNALKLTPNEAGANALADAASIPAWAKGAVGAVISAGFMSGYPDGSFGGSKGMTRAEAVSTLDRVLGNGSSNTNQPKGEVDTTDRDAQQQKEDNKKEEEKNTGNMTWSSGGGGGSSKKHSSSSSKVAVTGVTLDANVLEIRAGEKQKLTATVTPSKATNKDVTWTSSDESIATVDKNGTVTAVKEGNVTITVTTADGGYTDKCDISVIASDAVVATGVSLNKTTMSLEKGKTEKLIATVTPEDATNKDVTWTSSDESIATVDENGTVTAVEEGSVTITVTTVSGKHTASCDVTITASVSPEPGTPVAVTNVSLPSTLELEVNGSKKLTATITPSNATNKAVTWKSSDETVATVDATGTVKAVKAGTATITVTTEDGEKTASCTVTVEAAQNTGEASLPPEYNRPDISMTKTEETDEETNTKTVTINLQSDEEIEPGVTGVEEVADTNFILGGYKGADFFTRYAPDDFQERFTLVTLQIPLEAGEDGSFKLMQTNGALRDVFLQSGNVTGGASKWDGRIKEVTVNGKTTGQKETTRDISYFEGEKVYNYVFMVEKGETVEISIDWFDCKKENQGTTTKTSTTKYILNPSGLNFARLTDTEKAEAQAKAVELSSGKVRDGFTNKKGLEIAEKTVTTKGDTTVVDMALGGTVKIGALTTEDGEQTFVDATNNMFGSATWIAENATDDAKKNGYFVMSLDVPVPDDCKAQGFTAVQTNRALYDFYMSGDKVKPADMQSEVKNGSIIATKTKTYANTAYDTDPVDSNKKVLSFAFLVIKGEPVTLDFTFNNGTADKKVKYVIDTSNVTVDGTVAGGDVEGQPEVITGESSNGLPNPVLNTDENGETTITYEDNGKEVEGGTENADETSFDSMFGSKAKGAIGASYEGQQLVLTTIDVPIDELGAVPMLLAASEPSGTTVTMKQTNSALKDIAQYIENSSTDIKGDVWTKTLIATGNKLRVPVLVKPGEDVKLEFSTTDGGTTKTSKYNIVMDTVSVVEPKAAPNLENIKGLELTLGEGNANNEYTLNVAGSNIQAGPLDATKHGMTASVVDDLNTLFNGYDPFTTFFEKDYDNTKDDKKQSDNSIITYGKSLTALVRSAVIVEFSIPVPAGATTRQVKQVNPLLEAYQIHDTIHQYDPTSKTWFKEGSAVSCSDTSTVDLAILVAKDADITVEVTFMVDEKPQKVTYTVDTSKLSTKAYEPPKTQTTPETTTPAPTTTPETNTPETNTPQVDPSNTQQPSAGDDVQKEEPDAEENVTPPTTGEVTPPADDVTDKEETPNETTKPETETKPEDEQGKQDAEQKPEETTEPKETETNTGAEGEGNTDPAPEEPKETETNTDAEGEGNTDPAPEETKVTTEPTNSPFGEPGEM